LDQVVVNHINNYDSELLFNDIVQKRCEMCGYGPAITAMKVAKATGASKSRVLIYRNSSDITGDTDSVVGYLSAIFY
jgi:AmmeMemoRadiSam system protein B